MRTLLLVDDDPDFLAELDELLVGSGFACLCASQADQALALLQRHEDIALMISDLRMPEQSGLRLLQRLREIPRLARLPVIATSGHADMHDVIALLRLGIVDFLPKPIHYDRLFEALRRQFAEN